MPLYEYRCAACGKVFEAIQKFSDAPLEVHDGCGGKVERLISAPAFHLKGSGWYATDYAKSSSKSNGEKTETKPSDSKDTKDSKDSKPAATETKTESKPAAPAAKTD